MGQFGLNGLTTHTHYKSNGYLNGVNICNPIENVYYLAIPAQHVSLFNLIPNFVFFQLLQLKLYLTFKKRLWKGILVETDIFTLQYHTN